jgi:hypothetical protein
MNKVNINKVVKLLNDKPGYFKKGPSYLAELLNVKISDIKEAKKLLKSSKPLSNKVIAKTTNSKVNISTDNLTVKSHREWINAKGDTQSETLYTAPTKEISVESIKSLIEDLKTFKKPVMKSKKKTNSSVIGVLNIPDFHFDQVDDTTIEDNKLLFINTIYSLIENIKPDVNTIIFPVGNDFFNSDGASSKTTKGTQQFNKVSWDVAFKEGYKLIISAIDILVDNGYDVFVPIVQGNHARATETYLGFVLDAYYHNNNNVTIDADYKVIKTYSHGTTLLAFSHGELKSHNAPLILATEFPEQWGKSKYREILCGHIHMAKTNEYNGVRVRFLPSLVKSNEWHKLEGYSHLSASQMLYYDTERGFIGLDEINID